MGLPLFKGNCLGSHNSAVENPSWQHSFAFSHMLKCAIKHGSNTPSPLNDHTHCFILSEYRKLEMAHVGRPRLSIFHTAVVLAVVLLPGESFFLSFLQIKAKYLTDHL